MHHICISSVYRGVYVLVGNIIYVLGIYIGSERGQVMQSVTVTAAVAAAAAAAQRQQQNQEQRSKPAQKNRPTKHTPTKRESFCVTKKVAISNSRQLRAAAATAQGQQQNLFEPHSLNLYQALK